jgi:IS5 family transposase
MTLSGSLGYSGEFFHILLNISGFESLIHEKGTRNHPLSDAAKELNPVKSSIKSCVEHAFGCMALSMGGKLKKRFAWTRPRLVWCLKNLNFNLFEMLFFETGTKHKLI